MSSLFFFLAPCTGGTHRLQSRKEPMLRNQKFASFFTSCLCVYGYVQWKAEPAVSLFFFSLSYFFFFSWLLWAFFFFFPFLICVNKNKNKKYVYIYICVCVCVYFFFEAWAVDTVLSHIESDNERANEQDLKHTLSLSLTHTHTNIHTHDVLEKKNEHNKGGRFTATAAAQQHA